MQPSLLKRLFQHVCAAQREESVWEPVTLMGEFRGGGCCCPECTVIAQVRTCESVASEPELPIIPLSATLDVTQESYPMVVDSAAILFAVPANSHAIYITWHTANLSKTDARLGAHVIRMPLFSTLLAAVEVMACPLSLSPSVCCCIIAHVQHRNLVSLSCVAMREV